MARISSIFILSVTIIIILSVADSNDLPYYYNGNTYVFSNPVKKTWHQAYRFCNEKEMELLFIDTKGESDFIINLLKTTDEYNNASNHYWIGATDLGSERDWYWFSTGKHVDYANWAPNEPSFDGQCVHLWGSQKFMWNNFDCNIPAYFICKAKPCDS